MSQPPLDPTLITETLDGAAFGVLADPAHARRAVEHAGNTSDGMLDGFLNVVSTTMDLFSFFSD